MTDHCDKWIDKCEQQAAELARLREALGNLIAQARETHRVLQTGTYPPVERYSALRALVWWADKAEATIAGDSPQTPPADPGRQVGGAD